MLKEEVEEAVRNPKAGKSPGVDNIPSELLKNGGETAPTVLTVILPEDMGDEGMDEGVDTQSLVILFPKKGNLKQSQNYRTISLIGYLSNIMLKFILYRLKAKAEELLAEEQAGFRPGRNTVGEIFNSRVK